MLLPKLQEPIAHSAKMKVFEEETATKALLKSTEEAGVYESDTRLLSSRGCGPQLTIQSKKVEMTCRHYTLHKYISQLQIVAYTIRLLKT